MNLRTMARFCFCLFSPLSCLSSRRVPCLSIYTTVPLLRAYLNTLPLHFKNRRGADLEGEMSSLAWGFRGAALYYHCSKESSKHTARPCTPRQPCLQFHQSKNDIIATGSERDGSIGTQAAQETPVKRVGSVLYFGMHKKTLTLCSRYL